MKIVTHEHHCVQDDGTVLDDEWTMCRGGWLYGPCEDPGCGGTCQLNGDCECECHKAVEESEPATIHYAGPITARTDTGVCGIDLYVEPYPLQTSDPSRVTCPACGAAT